MTARNKLFEAPPYAVEHSIIQVGRGLRAARLRRNMTIAEVAERIGTGPRAVMEAEKGNPTTGIAVYAALLWIYNQLNLLNEIADPANDPAGQILDQFKSRERARKTQGLDNDF